MATHATVVAALLSRGPALPTQKTFLSRATFSGAKPIIEMKGSARRGERSPRKESDWSPRITVDAEGGTERNQKHDTRIHISPCHPRGSSGIPAAQSEEL